MNIEGLEWDDKNVEHISRHGVNPSEVENICFGFHISKKEKEKRHILSGQTDGGRYINVVLEHVSKGLFKPITAFDMSENYKRRYKARFKK